MPQSIAALIQGVIKLPTTLSYLNPWYLFYRYAMHVLCTVMVLMIAAQNKGVLKGMIPAQLDGG